MKEKMEIYEKMEINERSLRIRKLSRENAENAEKMQ